MWIPLAKLLLKQEENVQWHNKLNYKMLNDIFENKAENNKNSINIWIEKIIKMHFFYDNAYNNKTLSLRN